MSSASGSDFVFVGVILGAFAVWCSMLMCDVVFTKWQRRKITRANAELAENVAIARLTSKLSERNGLPMKPRTRQIGE